MNVSGAPVVKDNYSPNGNNIYLRPDHKINITGALDETANLGVTIEGGNGGVIALGFVTLTMLIGMALLLMLLKKRYGSEVIKKRAIRGEETGTCEWTVYTCAFVLALALYAPDILTVVLS